MPSPEWTREKVDLQCCLPRSFSYRVTSWTHLVSMPRKGGPCKTEQINRQKDGFPYPRTKDQKDWVGHLAKCSFVLFKDRVSWLKVAKNDLAPSNVVLTTEPPRRKTMWYWPPKSMKSPRKGQDERNHECWPLKPEGDWTKDGGEREADPRTPKSKEEGTRREEPVRKKLVDVWVLSAQRQRS